MVQQMVSDACGRQPAVRAHPLGADRQRDGVHHAPRETDERERPRPALSVPRGGIAACQGSAAG